MVWARLDVGMACAAFPGDCDKPFPEMQANVVAFGPLAAAGYSANHDSHNARTAYIAVLADSWMYVKPSWT